MDRPHALYEDHLWKIHTAPTHPLCSLMPAKSHMPLNTPKKWHAGRLLACWRRQVPRKTLTDMSPQNSRPDIHSSFYNGDNPKITTIWSLTVLNSPPLPPPYPKHGKDWVPARTFLLWLVSMCNRFSASARNHNSQCCCPTPSSWQVLKTFYNWLGDYFGWPRTCIGDS